MLPSDWARSLSRIGASSTVPSTSGKRHVVAADLSSYRAYGRGYLAGYAYAAVYLDLALRWESLAFDALTLVGASVQDITAIFDQARSDTRLQFPEADEGWRRALAAKRIVRSLQREARTRA